MNEPMQQGRYGLTAVAKEEIGCPKWTSWWRVSPGEVSHFMSRKRGNERGAIPMHGLGKPLAVAMGSPGGLNRLPCLNFAPQSRPLFFHIDSYLAPQVILHDRRTSRHRQFPSHVHSPP